MITRLEKDRAFKPIAPNPFITGNPVRDPNLFFGREEDFAFARQRLIAEKEGGVLLFVGERRSGKTSILFQILNGRLGDEFLPIFIDMQALSGVTGDREFFERLAANICEQAPDDRIRAAHYDFPLDNPALVFDRLLDDVQGYFPGRRPIFLFDETEILHRKVESGELGGNVLVYMASILESRRLYFFFTGSRHLGESRGEQWRRLIGKATYRVISFLSREDALRLIRKPVEGRVFYGEGVVEAIYRLTSGHPYYTQYICTTAVDYLNSVQRNTLVMEDLDEITHTIVDNPPPNMVYIWDELTPAEQMALSLLSQESEDENAFITAEALVEAIQKNNYPLDITTETLRGTMEGLYQREILDRQDAGAYRFRGHLFCLWIRRARSIWRLVKEEQPGRIKRSLLTGVALAAVALALGAALWVVDRSAKVPPGLTPALPATGDLWVESEPAGVEVLIGGRVYRTPAYIPKLAAGAYTIEARRANYHTWSQSVEVQADRTDSLKVRLQRITGHLSVTSRPPGAQVQVRGEVARRAATPFRDLELPTGTYDVLVSSAGYVEQRRRINVTDSTETELAFDLLARVGDLYVDSAPRGAALSLDGADRPDKTPAWLRGLAVGTHRLGLELEGYQPRDTTFNVRLNSSDTLLLALALLPATLELVSRPAGAAVYLDGTSLGVAPGVWTLHPGPHRVRVQLEGYETHELVQDFLPGRRYTPEIQMQSHYGWVQIVKPLFGTILIDGSEQVKVPPGIVPLRVGDHTLRTVNGPEGERIHVTRGDTVRVSLP